MEWMQFSIVHNATAHEVSSFLSVLLLSSYRRLPEEDHYWSNCEDLGVPRLFTVSAFDYARESIHESIHESIRAIHITPCE